MAHSVQVGDFLPNFRLQDQNGIHFSSSQYLGKKNMVIYFYPKDETAVCTAQACSFRDNYEVFKDLNCEVIGISSDGKESHQNFAAHYRLPFTLLSDTKKEVRSLLGVPKDLFGLLPGRYTYVIDKKGKVILIFNSSFSAKKHIEAALAILK